MAESSQPALHPERIRAAIKQLRDTANPDKADVYALNGWHLTVETAIAALALVRKGQLAIGLTGDVADASKAALQLIATIQKIGR